MGIPAFNPVVLEEDRAKTVEAFAVMYREKVRLYARLDQLMKIAKVKQSHKLEEATNDWMHHGEMILSTNFDEVHFRAQIKHRHSIGRLDHVEELEKTLAAVVERNQNAKEKFPAARDHLEKVYAEVMGCQTKESE